MLDSAQWDPNAPTRWEDIVGNEAIWGKLVEAIRTNTCPHIVLAGPAGCGKSLFVRLALGSLPVLRIECTANAGLRDMRDGLRGFARGSRTAKGDYRWVVLEHADALAGDTQAFLRRMMETTSHSTRFLFECSDAGAISEPILSRSTLYTVQSPSESEMRYELQRRTAQSLTDSELVAIHHLACGNMRSALYHALAVRWNRDVYDCVGIYETYKRILGKRPKTTKGTEHKHEREWLDWALYAERECRLTGTDCRELLLLGWPTNPDIAYMRNQWSRLGGISARALFFRAVRSLRISA